MYTYQFSYHPAFSVPDFACFCALLSILARLLQFHRARLFHHIYGHVHGEHILIIGYSALSPTQVTNILVGL